MKTELSAHYPLRKLAVAAIPTIGMMIVTSIYSVVDGYFVSNYAGKTEFAAMNIIWPVIALVSAVGLMIGTGGSALVSKTLGEGNMEKTNSIFTQLVRLCAEAGIVLGVLLFALMKPVVIALGAEGEMVPLAVAYGRIVVLAMPLFILQMAFQSFYMTAERPELGTRMSIICGCLNIALDALFIIGFGWGLKGAAIATAIALATGGLYPLLFFRSKRNTTHLQFVRGGRTGAEGAKRGRIDWKSIGKSCSNGLSEYVVNVAFNVVGIAYNLQLMRYIGENGVSAYGIIMYVGFIFGAVFIGYNLCVSQVIAFHFGAGNRKERIYMLSFLLCGFNMFCSAWFTALGNGKVSAIAAFVRTLIFELATIFILPRFLGIDGIWSAVCVAELLAFALTVALISRLRV